MAATTPFEVEQSATAGKGVTFNVTTTSQNSTIACKNAPSVCVAFCVPNTPAGSSQSMCWVRLSTEAAPTATNADIPMPPNTVRIFANPAPFGTLGIAVICTVSATLAPAAVLSVVPGEGGI